MKKHRFTVLIERDEDGYLVATVPALKSCYTQAQTMEKPFPGLRKSSNFAFRKRNRCRMSFEAVQQIEIMACAACLPSAPA